MLRREFIALVGGAAALPIAARAQPPAKLPVIGVLLANPKEHPLTAPSVAAFTAALAELGWTDGNNVRIEYRWAASDNTRIQAFARELVGEQPMVILAQNTSVAAALRRETKTIPIVFISVSDPIQSGLVASLSHPGGNITGFANFEPSLAGKWIELLKDTLFRSHQARYARLLA
jgi:putative tryptophan/tyrosine transport system substrate-binding protein